ncbi:hypothetical protein HZU75_03580 [Chitinibacter fontanus]|uniref:DUF2975 domain-containing protein n=1 Tax=Chitinibacter fontanus TaxID=1737446 RepID=A0A7D5Z3P1_9NEIS|nr:hypothetical protein [Chitinibacter fontanus]QLI80683.1 hypothetical protein HZU75_03580 [Chitinibacter fontanus]
MQHTLYESNIFVRAIYCLCLLFICLALLSGLTNLISMLAKPAQLGLMNIIVGLVPNLTTAIMFFLVAFRFFGVLIGKFKLNVISTSRSLNILRIIAIILMALSVLPWLISLIGALAVHGADGVGFVFLLGNTGGGAILGVLLFEASRLFERELLIDSQLGRLN